MEPVQGAKDLVLPDIAPFVSPVFAVFDEIADHQSEVARNRGEHADDPVPPTDLQDVPHEDGPIFDSELLKNPERR